MGQINSVNHGQQRQGPNTRGNTNVAHAEESLDSQAIHELVESGSVPPNIETTRQDNVNEKQSRWQSVRNSLISPNDSGPLRNKQGGAAKSEDKKRWRVSRRWSKAPTKAQFDPVDNTTKGPPVSLGTDGTEARSVIYDPHLMQEVDASIEHPERRERLSVLVGPENTSAAGPSSLSVTGLSYSEKQSLDADDDNSDTANTYVDFGAPEHTIEQQSVSEPAAVSVEGNPVAMHETTSDGAVGDPGSGQASSSNDTQLDVQQSNEEPALRQLVQGRTLVVVQGVVHTTSTPRLPEQISSSPSSEPPRPSPELDVTSRAPSQGDNLFPNLLHQTNSGTSSRSRRSLVDSEALETNGSEMVDVNSMGEVNSNSTPESFSNLSSSPSYIPPETTTSAIPVDPSNVNHNMPRRTPQANSSGVDVLGALLSVAAAATAASLLSVSPQRRSALQHAGMPQIGVFSTPGAESSPMLTPGSSSPMPVLARTLASTNPITTAAIAQREREHEREENERNGTRNLWENMRERIMRVRNRTQSDQGGNTRTDNENGSTSAHGSNSAIPDTLFNTLTRAFSLDQTQDGEQSTSQSINGAEIGGGSSPSHEGQRAVDQERTSSDGFEQFLIDLQTDVRNVLLELENTASSTTATDSIPTSVSGSSSANGSSTNDRPTIIHGNNSNIVLPLQRDLMNGNQSEVEASPPEAVSATVPEDDGNITLAPNTMPAVTNVADGASSNALSSPVNLVELDENAHRTSQSRDSRQSSQPSQPAMLIPNFGQSTTVHGRGVNWWRMYRFPPTRMNLTRQNAGANSPISNNVVMEGASSFSAPTEESSSSRDSPLPTPNDTDITPSPSSTDNNLVVPVIVVGLQSINGPSRVSRLPENSQSTSGSRLSDARQRTQEMSDYVDANVSADNDEARRGRNWHSRATRLLHRMGRRNASVDQDLNISQELASSRTYFIYVMGGYYPPDHHIVSGSDLFDSFEALWDLADLLGQVKPPIATEEELQGSGLEIIKASSLQEFENANKLAGNCVERCLICLDDYEPEDDIRLLSCKHAFHKSCVDHWLTTGRNNCPACRSKGVPTYDEQPAQNSASSS